MPSVGARLARLAFLLAAVQAVGAEPLEPLPGAATILEKVRSEGGPRVEPRTFSHFSRQLRNYQKAMLQQPAEESVKEYLRLCDEFFKQSPTYAEAGAQAAFNPVAFLPPPAAWPTLKEAILARTAPKLDDPAAQLEATIRELAFRLLAATLTQDEALHTDTYAALQALNQLAPKYEKERLDAFFTAHCHAVIALWEKPETILAALTDQLPILAARTEATPLAIPDLVAQAGEEKVRPFLEQALVTPNVVLSIPPGTATHRLAREIAEQKINDLKLPPWTLAHDVLAGSLYKRLEKRFGESEFKPIPGVVTNVSPDEMVARQYYLLSLLRSRKEVDANTFLARVANTDGLLERAEAHGLDGELFRVWQKRQEKAPIAAHWHPFTQLGMRLGESEAVLNLLRAQLAKSSPEKSPDLSLSLATLLLSLDQVQEALSILSQLPDAEPLTRKVALALNQPAVEPPPASGPSVSHLVEGLKAAPEKSLPAALALARLYHERGQSKDLLTLVDNFPFWGAGDLKEFLPRQPELPLLTASALIATGQPEKGRLILQTALAHDPTLDRAYEMLCQLDGMAVLPLLDALAKYAPQHALLWKAQLLFEHKKGPEAEKALRTVIAHDPSGTRQAVDSLIRAYSILSNIRMARGDMEEAQACRRMVQALQLTQQADRAVDTGLHQRAIRLYRSALELQENLFLAQANLARVLAETGQADAAKPHFQKAFELMPESALPPNLDALLKTKVAQTLAEAIFQARAQQEPPSAQAHYLLGLVHEAQGRPAFADYLKTVELAPELREAWVRLRAITRREAQPALERDRIALQLYRRTPAEQRQPTDLADVSNLRALWESVHQLETAKLAPAEPQRLYPLLGALQYGPKSSYWQVDWPTPTLAGMTLGAQWKLHALAPLLNRDLPR